jgi:hypothetical protein
VSNARNLSEAIRLVRASARISLNLCQSVKSVAPCPRFRLVAPFSLAISLTLTTDTDNFSRGNFVQVSF